MTGKYNKAYYDAHPEAKRNLQESIRKSRAKTKDRDQSVKNHYKKTHVEQINVNAVAERVPMKENCEFCGSTDNLCRHHLDYNFPKIFLTVCQSCHKAIHGHLKS